jgi:hypothetical protein
MISCHLSKDKDALAASQGSRQMCPRHEANNPVNEVVKTKKESRSQMNSIDAATRAAAAVVLTFAITTTPSVSQESRRPIAKSSSERASVMTMKDDLANRSSDIHWPKGFMPADADLFSHNELFINASCQRVWRHIVEATRWPEWYPNSKDVRILGDGGTVLNQGTTFRWTTFGLPLESRINEFVPYSRIGGTVTAPTPPLASITLGTSRRRAMPALSSPTRSAWGATLRICARPTRA